MLTYKQSTCIYCKTLNPVLPLATAAEFAKAHQVTQRTVQRWLQTGKIRSFQITRTKTGGYFHAIPACGEAQK